VILQPWGTEMFPENSSCISLKLVVRVSKTQSKK